MGSLEDFPAKESPPALNLPHSSIETGKFGVELEIDAKDSILGENWEGDMRESENLEGENQKKIINEHPLRPHAKDCSFYLRTGDCKFGFFCMYNHPVKTQEKENKKEWVPLQRKDEAEIKEKEEESEKDCLMEQKGEIECRYYLTAGGCKYGDYCRYGHFKHFKKSDLPRTELNFLGLPIRRLQKECPFYMQTGACAYGLSCRYNHPDPTADEGPDTDRYSYAGGLNSYLEPWFSNLKLDDPVSYYHNKSSYESTRFQERVGDATKMNNFFGFHQEQTKTEEFPERPGMPDCNHFKKTGYCKFKSSCRYNHPKAKTQPVPVLNSRGLPLRPGMEVCRHYEKFGVCKFGRNCFYHHPGNFA